MNYLLDVNILVAWGWADHADHDRVEHWIVASKKTRGTKLLTSTIPELGFARMSIHRSRGQIAADEAGDTLGGLIKALGKRHAFLPDDQTARRWPAWCQSASRTNDAHLLALAHAHGAELATLDGGIPGAFVIPQ